MDIASYITGALTAGVGSALGSVLQYHLAARARREEREAQASARREERQEQLSQQHFERVRDLYLRTTQLALEYRQFQGGDAERWQAFIARFVAVKGELELDGSNEVRDAFKAYLDKVQDADYEAMFAPPEPEPEPWQHHDRELDQLTQVIRNELAQREQVTARSSSARPTT